MDWGNWGRDVKIGDIFTIGGMPGPVYAEGILVGLNDSAVYKDSDFTVKEGERVLFSDTVVTPELYAWFAGEVSAVKAGGTEYIDREIKLFNSTLDLPVGSDCEVDYVKLEAMFTVEP